MDAVTPKNNKHDTLDTHSHLVRPADMEWKKTRFPGCEVKPLLADKETGLVTALMRFEPGAILPDHAPSECRSDPGTARWQDAARCRRRRSRN